METAKLTHETRLRVTNPDTTEATLLLEPWGETYAMPAGGVFEVHAEGPEGGAMEVAVEKSVVAVWAWPGSTVRLFQGETELGGDSRRPAVPYESAKPPILPRLARTGAAAKGEDRLLDQKRGRRISLTVTDREFETIKRLARARFISVRQLIRLRVLRLLLEHGAD